MSWGWTQSCPAELTAKARHSPPGGRHTLWETWRVKSRSKGKQAGGAQLGACDHSRAAGMNNQAGGLKAARTPPLTEPGPESKVKAPTGGWAPAGSGLPLPASGAHPPSLAFPDRWMHRASLSPAVRWPLPLCGPLSLCPSSYKDTSHCIQGHPNPLRPHLNHT